MRLPIILCCAILLLALATACPQAHPAAKATAPGALATREPRGPGGNTGGSPPPGGGSLIDVSALPSGTAPRGANFVWLKTRDQYNIAAWYYPAPTPKVRGTLAPAVLLLHQRGKDKSSWGSFPDKLVREGFAVIAIDFRGHGETLDPYGHSIPLDSLQNADYMNMLLDVQAAHEYIAAQDGVDPDRIGIIGASIGANLALMYCSGDRRVRTVVALSPGMNYKGLEPLKYMDGVDKRAVYLIASKGDQSSADACDQLSHSGVVEGLKSERLFEGTAHGTDMLTAHPGLDETIIGGWLLNTIPPKR